MTKKFYVVSYEENGVTKYYTDKKDTDLFAYETSDIFEAKRYVTYRKAENYVNNTTSERSKTIDEYSDKEVKMTQCELTFIKATEWDKGWSFGLFVGGMLVAVCIVAAFLFTKLNI